MNKFIVKTLSLCLSMALLLSGLAMPAFAEEADHTHTYQTSSVSYSGYSNYSDSEHARTKTTTYTCIYSGCGDSHQDVDLVVESHSASGAGTLEYTFTNHVTGDVVYYYRYTCRVCHGSFVVKIYG